MLSSEFLHIIADLSYDAGGGGRVGEAAIRRLVLFAPWTAPSGEHLPVIGEGLLTCQI